MSGALTRLADPEPDVWLADFGQIMQGTDYAGVCYGNFWARLPCRIRRHRWVGLRLTTEPPDHDQRWARRISRCRRCGSQVHQWIGVNPPTRGAL